MGIPPPEFTVDTNLVARLLHSQHPDLAGLPIQFLTCGWDNYLFRAGEEFVVRLPRRQVGEASICREQKYLPDIAPRLPITVSLPVRTGKPDCGYPWHWHITLWIEGESADISPPNNLEVKQWARFLSALHITGPKDGPRNPLRGVPLVQRHNDFAERLQRLADRKLVAYQAFDHLWQSGLDADDTFTSCWLHGDLHPMNILCRNGILSGVIDWGDLCIGDVATDLASFWMLFDKDIAEHSLLHDYRAGRAQIIRAKASAAFFAVVLLDAGYGEHPQQVAMARNIISNLGLP